MRRRDVRGGARDAWTSGVDVDGAFGGVSTRWTTADVRGGHGRGRGERTRFGAAATPRGLFAPADLFTASHVTPNHRELAEEPLAKHPDLREALRQSARVGDLLLKREAREIEEIDKYAEELEKLEKDPFAGAREAPCGVEAEKVRACYGSNAKNVTACREVVDEYKKCGSVVAQIRQRELRAVARAHSLYIA